MKLKYTYALLAFVLTLGLSACHSNKPSGTNGYDNEENIGNTERRSLDNAYKTLTEAYNPWNDLRMPIKMTLSEPRRLSVSGTLNMQYGKALSITLKALFFEIATVYADNDSLIVVSKMADAYYKESLESLRRYSGLDLRDMQSLLLGQLFVPGGSRATAGERKKFELTDLNASEAGAPEMLMKLTPRDLPSGVDAYFTATQALNTPEPAFLRSLELKANTTNVTFGFYNLQSTPAGPASSEMEINAGLKSRKFKAGLTLNYDRANWGGGGKIDKPSIPRSARRLTFAQIYKLLQSL